MVIFYSNYDDFVKILNEVNFARKIGNNRSIAFLDKSPIVSLRQ